MDDRLFGRTKNWSLFRCLNIKCNLIWQSPTLIEDELFRLYQSYYTHKLPKHLSKTGNLRRGYTALKERLVASELGYKMENYNPKNLSILRSAFKSIFRRKWNEILFEYMFVDRSFGERVLEIGFGNGEVLDKLSAQGWDVYGIEFDEVAVDNACNRFVNVECATIATTTYKSIDFDCVLMSHVIEHLYDPIKNLRLCFDVLKSGGKLIIVTPNSSSLGHTLFGRHWLHLDQPRHLQIFNVLNLQSMAEKAGFKIYDSFTINRDPINLFGSSMRFKNNIPHEMGDKFTAIEKIASYLLSTIESLLLRLLPNIGEEIVIVLEKP